MFPSILISERVCLSVRPSGFPPFSQSHHVCEALIMVRLNPAQPRPPPFILLKSTCEEGLTCLTRLHPDMRLADTRLAIGRDCQNPPDDASLANDSSPRAQAASHWSSSGSSTDVTLTAPGRGPAIVRHPNSSGLLLHI